MNEKQSFRWENDSSLLPMSAARQKRVNTMVFQTFQRQGLTPDQLRDKEMAKEYAAWLADQTSQ